MASFLSIFSLVVFYHAYRCTGTCCMSEDHVEISREVELTQWNLVRRSGGLGSLSETAKLHLTK